MRKEFLIDPARSFPNDIGVIPVAKAVAAQPPLLPPLVLVVSHGLLVLPKTGLSACMSIAKTERFVFPIIIAPSDRRSFTNSASVSGIYSFKR
jgi:hypothetical protein